jgi:hypothetical protein
MRAGFTLAAITISFVIVHPALASDQIPTCRLDDALKTIVTDTLRRAIATYGALGKALPIEAVDVNPMMPSARAKALEVYVVHDAMQGNVTGQGCAKGPVGRER